jgi:uncharacterized phiE125 gp8 family phage protein
MTIFAGAACAASPRARARDSSRVAAAAIPTPPAAIAAAKVYLRIDHADEDTLLAQLVASAIAHGEGFTGQLLITRAVEETIPATAAWRRLGRTPVRAITEVAVEDAASVATPLAIDQYGIDIDAGGDGWVRLTAAGAAGRLRVRYSAGLADGWEALPEPIRQGAIRLASHLYTHRDAAADAAPPAAVAALWRPWRRMRLA